MPSPTQIRGAALGGTSQIKPLSIADADVGTAAAIASTKLATWSASRDAGSNFLKNLLDPVDPQDAATRAFVLATVLGLFKFVGNWNATTNTPAIPVATAANNGNVYIVSVASVGVTAFANVQNAIYEIGDYLISDGATGWFKIDNTDKVTSVAGRTGDVVLASADISDADIDPVADVLALRDGSGGSGFSTIWGSIAASGTLTLTSTSHATKGLIQFGTSTYDEANNYLGIGLGATPPDTSLHVIDSVHLGIEDGGSAMYLNAGDALLFYTNSGVTDNLLAHIDGDGQMTLQFMSGFSPNAGQKAGLTMQPETDELPDANEAPSIMLRTTPATNVPGHFSARWVLMDANGGMDFRIRDTVLGSQSYFLHLSGNDGLVASKGGFALSGFDPSGLPTHNATLTYDATFGFEFVALNQIVATGGFKWEVASVPVMQLDSVGKVTLAEWNATKISEAYGGTNQSTYALGDTLYASAANTLSKLAGNIAATPKILSQTGTGAVSAAPAWALPTAAIPQLDAMSRYYIGAGETVTIPANYNFIVCGDITNDGAVVNDGRIYGV